MDLKLEIHTDLHKMKENKTMFHSYKCDNCCFIFNSKLKIINEEKFCGTDCRSSWYIRKYVNDNTKCYEVLSKDFNEQFIK